MKRKPHSSSLVLLLVCIFTFWWGISVLAQRDIQSGPALGVGQPSASVPSGAANTTSLAPLVVTESISGSTRIYNGTYTPKSLCDSFGSGIRYSAANGGHVTVLLISQPSLVNCAQAAGTDTGEPFTVSIKLGAGSNPVFDGVLLNGAPIPAQLVVSK